MVEEVKKEDTSEEAKPEFEKKLEEMKAENERMEKNITEMKELKAIGVMSGNTEPAKEEAKKEESNIEYKNRVMSGEKLDG